MNRLALIFALLVFCTPLTHSQLVEENFDYPAGDSIGAHGWVNFSGGSTNRIVAVSPGLTFPDYNGSGIGNAAELLGTGQDSYIPFVSVQTTGNIYASMIVKIDTAKSGDYFAAFLTSTSTNNFFARLYAKMSTNGNISFGISKTTSASGGIFYTDSVYSTGISYLIVLKYAMAPGSTNDSVCLFVFSTSAPATEPVPTLGPITGTATDPADLGRFALRQGTSSSSPNLHIDGILISTLWDNSLLPVELTSFYSIVDEKNVTLFWSTSSEENNRGFEIERRQSSVIDAWEKAGFVSGNGSTFIPQNYSFRDIRMQTGKYLYRLRQIDFNGNCRFYQLADAIEIGTPSIVKVYQNYPNPFNPVTTINFDIPQLSEVKVTVIDISGRELFLLADGRYEGGYHSLQFDASSLSSGIYFYKMEVKSNGIQTNFVKRMILLK